MQSSFFAHFMCFEVPALVPPGGLANSNKNAHDDDDANYDDLGIMDIDENDSKAGNALSFFLLLPSLIYGQLRTTFYYLAGKNTGELEALNESLHDLLDGIQVMRHFILAIPLLFDYNHNGMLT